MWPRAKLKFVARLGYGETLPRDEPQDGAFRVFGSNGPFASFSRANTGAPAIIIGRKGSYGKVNWTAKPCFASDTTFFIDESTSLNHLRWIYWLLQTLRLDEGTDEAAIPGLNRETAYARDVLVPPLSHQRAIADYLDRETTRLDALVAEKERLLDLLAEKHRALITRAVTRGFDLNIPLRDSGISWLGEIPAHWEIWKLGHSAAVGNGSTPSRSNAAYWTEGTIPWLRSSVVNQDEVTKADEFVTPAAVRECNLPLVGKGSVLIAIVGQGKTRGQAAVLSCDAAINQNLAFVAPDCSRLSTWFLRWIFLSAYEYIRSISDDASGPKGILTCEDIANLRIPIPPIDEQYAINAHIATLSARINQLRIATECSIRLIKERRAAVITAAVTGKIEMGKDEAVQHARRIVCQEKVKA